MFLKQQEVFKNILHLKNNNEQGSIIENLLYRFEYEGLFFWEVKQYDYTKG